MKVLSPTDEEELVRVFRSSYGRKIAVYGTGAHSKLKEAEVAITTRAMKSFEVRGDEVEAEAGVLVPDIREVAAQEDLLFPSVYDGSLGGLLASNEPGPLSTKYGRPSQSLIWVRGVTGIGLVKWRGLAGSKGLIGAISRARLKLYRRPSHVYSLTVEVDGEAQYLETLKKLSSNGPLSVLVVYDGVVTVHASYDRKVSPRAEEGLDVVRENDSDSYLVESKFIEPMFYRLAVELKPTYAYTVLGTHVAKVYSSNREELSKFGSVLGKGELPAAWRLLKAFLDFRRSLV
ncbi:FAD-binding oxidoreductase [Sulfodiicoccus acidiphilus]|uniref:FAD-binding oxidoreductase n=1 Tax=Sulfodiicoccus acidiphilus TaxID=1670455 RepID=UPI0016633FF5|nr:FAD-binding protein [Sulfodiicoccus acidiphilus]